jgi:hypothetical protein
MNAEMASSFSDAFRDMRGAFGVSATIAGQAVDVLANESPFANELVSGGIVDDGEIELKALASDLTIAPANGNPVTYRGRNFLISHVAQQPGSDIIEIRCRPLKGR